MKKRQYEKRQHMKDARIITKRLCRIFFCGALAVTAFIFYQSCKSMDESGVTSGALMALLKPIFDPNNRIPVEVFHHYLRKTAHFVEFCALGICWGVYAWQRGVLKGRRYVAMPMLLTLATAVADEYLQYFTYRGSAVTDVVLDYSGALTGLAVVYLISLCVKWIQKKCLSAEKLVDDSKEMHHPHTPTLIDGKTYSFDDVM